MSKKDKPIPKRVQQIVEQCRKGQMVCLTLRHSAVGDERLYWFEPSGKTAPPKATEKAVELGLLVPNRDGLFGDSDSQTYRVAEPA